MVFQTTQWSLVLMAGSEKAESEAALEELCELYWKPLYVYLLSKGRERESARDAVQDFFVHLLSSNIPRKADRDLGRFRTFLLTSLDNFLASQHRNEHRQKRGGEYSRISIDAIPMEDLALSSAEYSATPSEAFDRQWAIECTKAAFKVVEAEYGRRGKQSVFDALSGCMSSPRAAVNIPTKAEELAMSEQAVRVALHRLRKRYGKALEEEVCRTVQDPSQVQEELAYLIQVLGRA